MPKKKKQIDIDKVFSEVLILVEKGLTIDRACQIVKINRSTFYKLISETQKNLIKSTKIICGTTDIWSDYQRMWKTNRTKLTN